MLRDAADAASVGVWDWNLVTGVFRCSERTKVVFGHAKEAAVSYADLQAQTVAADRDRMESALRKAFDPAGTGVYVVEHKIGVPTEEVRSVSVCGKAYFGDVQGTRKAIRFTGIVLDNSEQRLARESMQEAEKLASVRRSLAVARRDVHNHLHAAINLLGIIRQELDPKQREMLVRLAKSELGRAEQVLANDLADGRGPVRRV